MCNKENLFDTNVRKFDTQNTFFCPECLDRVNHWEKLFFLEETKLVYLGLNFS